MFLSFSHSLLLFFIPSFFSSTAVVGVGLSSGQVYVLNALTLEDVQDQAMFHYSKKSISHIIFSSDSNYMATAVSTCVYIDCGFRCLGVMF